MLGAVVFAAVFVANKPYPLSIVLLTVVSILFGLALGPIARAVQLAEEKRQARTGARIAARDAIPIDQLYRTFYEGSDLKESDVTELWLEVAETLHLDPNKMRPTDRFDKEYAPVGRGWSRSGVEELEDLNDTIRLRCDEQGIPYRHINVETLDDYIRLLSGIAHGQCPAKA